MKDLTGEIEKKSYPYFAAMAMALCAFHGIAWSEKKQTHMEKNVKDLSKELNALFERVIVEARMDELKRHIIKIAPFESEANKLLVNYRIAELNQQLSGKDGE